MGGWRRKRWFECAAARQEWVGGWVGGFTVPVVLAVLFGGAVPGGGEAEEGDEGGGVEGGKEVWFACTERWVGGWMRKVGGWTRKVGGWVGLTERVAVFEPERAEGLEFVGGGAAEEGVEFGEEGGVAVGVGGWEGGWVEMDRRLYGWWLIGD